ncbi:hypothetical protein Tco_0590213, partial [Tanacetum coccineum]
GWSWPGGKDAMDHRCGLVTLNSGNTLLTPSFDDYESVMFFPFSSDSGRLGCRVSRMVPNVEVNLRGLFELDKSDLSDTATKLAWAKPNKRSGDADLSKDKSGPEPPPAFWRSWCVEGDVRFGVISPVLMQRYLRTTRQRYSPCEGPQSLK